VVDGDQVVLFVSNSNPAGVPVGKDSEPSFEATQLGVKRSQLLFEKKSLIPELQQLMFLRSLP
jgi:hypothetical protein